MAKGSRVDPPVKNGISDIDVPYTPSSFVLSRHLEPRTLLRLHPHLWMYPACRYSRSFPGAARALGILSTKVHKSFTLQVQEKSRYYSPVLSKDSFIHFLPAFRHIGASGGSQAATMQNLDSHGMDEFLRIALVAAKKAGIACLHNVYFHVEIFLLTFLSTDF